MWSTDFYYDETSPSCLRWNRDLRVGRNGQILLIPMHASAGGLDSDGYYRGMVNNKFYKAHRVVWEMFNGKIPEGMLVDHIDTVRTNNRIENLRLVDCKLSARNRGMCCTNSSGTTGVSCKKSYLVSGQEVTAWSASWFLLDGTRKFKTFSENKYGTVAKQMAIDYRTKKIVELNQESAGYTDNHGININKEIQ